MPLPFHIAAVYDYQTAVYFSERSPLGRKDSIKCHCYANDASFWCNNSDAPSMYVLSLYLPPNGMPKFIWVLLRWEGMYYADNVHVQQTALGLLGVFHFTLLSMVPPLWMIIHSHFALRIRLSYPSSSTYFKLPGCVRFEGVSVCPFCVHFCRINIGIHGQERGQFTVAFVVQTVVFLYFRWYVWIPPKSLAHITNLPVTLFVSFRFVCVQGMYGVVRYEFPSFSWHPSDYFYFVGAIWIPNFMTIFTMSFLLYECVCGVVCLVTNDVYLIYSSIYVHADWSEDSQCRSRKVGINVST